VAACTGRATASFQAARIPAASIPAASKITTFIADSPWPVSRKAWSSSSARCSRKKQALFERLSTGQSPEALFITCSDSRIKTAMLTQTDPGELFICRNAGNIVPLHTNQTGGMTASIEFAIGALRIPNIVICGHTQCGPIKGAMKAAALTNLPHVRKWLGYAQGATGITAALGGNLGPEAKMRMLPEQNVILQLQHLKTHQAVAVALAHKSFGLHGWAYDIKTGEVAAYADASASWVPAEERYAADLASEMLSAHAC